eukprot:GFUD01063703.1.p1 GENE.GFUD01063703.1~~GFUD01063703.1.p1  ORF type:complete len:440 (+),score=90.89 GFUD01063703.1:219-1538(+)
MADLDSLLVDLESSIEHRGSASASQQGKRVTDFVNTQKREEGGRGGARSRQDPRSQLGVGHPASETMTTAALSNNLNELDILLQDLSAARYSGHVEHHETITESRSYSTHSNSFPVPDTQDLIVPPKPPERAKPKTPSKFSLNGDHHELHAVERSRTEETNQTRTLSTDNGGNLDQSKWEYMGFGIWENRDPDEPSPPAVRRYSSETARNMQTVQSRASNGCQVALDGTSASTATAELDDLMTSLNNFKMDADRNVDEPVIGGAPNLDDMLGNLQEDMNKQGIKTKQKGVCEACTKPIVGQVITALGHTWHPEHFMCSHCNQELGTMNFFERDGKPYCEQDYHHLFSPRCGYCQGPILDKCISALDQTWHPEHFFCSDCGRQFGDEGFHEKDDAAFCKDCYFEQFAPKCGGCNTPITENYISSLNLQVGLTGLQLKRAE